MRLICIDSFFFIARTTLKGEAHKVSDQSVPGTLLKLLVLGSPPLGKSYYKDRLSVGANGKC